MKNMDTPPIFSFYQNNRHPQIRVKFKETPQIGWVSYTLPHIWPPSAKNWIKISNIEQDIFEAEKWFLPYLNPLKISAWHVYHLVWKW